MNHRLNLLIRALNGRGSTYDLSGDYIKAINDFKIISHYKTYQYIADFGISEVLEKMGRYHQSLRYSERALNNCSDVMRKIEIINQKAFLLMRLGNFKGAKTAERTAQSLLKKIKGYKMNVDNYSGRSYYNLSVFFLHSGKFTSALEYAKKSLKCSSAIRDKRRQGLSYNLLGVIYKKMNKPDLSLKYYHKSLHYFTEVGDVGQIAGVYNNMGNLEKDLKNAIFFLKKARSIFSKIGYSMGITESMHNLANNYLALGACNKAFLEYTKALLLAKKMSYKFAISINLTGIGKVYKLWGNYRVAYNYFFRALRLATEMNDKEGILENTYMIALLKCEKNESDALRWLEDAETLTQEMSDQFFLSEILYEKIRYLTYLKDYTKISQFEKMVRKLSIKDFRLRKQSLWLLIKWELQNYYNKMAKKKQTQILVNKLERLLEQTQDREIIFYIGRALVEFFLIHNLKKAGAIYSILDRVIKEEMRCYYSEIVFLGAKLNYYRGEDWEDGIKQALALAQQIGKKRLILEIQEWLKSKRLKIDFYRL